MMEIRSHLLHAYLGGVLAIIILVHVHAQNQLGFISLDCGRREDSSYTDETTGLNYVPDTTFLDSASTGVSRIVSYDYYDDSFGQRFYAVRSFPEGDRNCYTLKPDQGRDSKYLIRAQFLYGNYDGSAKAPSFDLYIGANKWGSVKSDDASITTKEIIYIPSSEYVMVCLVNTGRGTPFISVLELRPLKGSTYETANQAAVLHRRLDLGSLTSNPIRYKDDVHDRIWQPFNTTNSKVLSTSEPIKEKQIFQPPSTVMATAVVPTNSSAPLSFYFPTDNNTTKYYFYMHFSEVEKLETNQSREFSIYYKDVLFYGPFTLDYLSTTTVHNILPLTGDDKVTIEFIKSETSKLPPIINAVEIYFDPNFLELQTDEQDVEAMIKFKSMHGVKRNWQGDPCAPKAYMWYGLNCSFNGTKSPPRIVSLDLSSSGLTGEITFYINNLKMIRFLNFSNNHLNGSIPDFLSKLKFLKVLDLGNNNFTGSVPLDLMKRSNNGLLLLSVAGNPNLIHSHSSIGKTHKHRKIASAVASAASLLVFLIALLVGWRLVRRKRMARKADKTKALRKLRSALEPKNHQFTYSEIMAITDNFESLIGKGGFGTVYHGYLNDAQVAVKMLSESSAQGYKEFQAEVKLLLIVHHVNLTSLIGYCYENSYMGLIYEYMTNGNLGRYLSGKIEHSLSWQDRLSIAVDAGQGLEYLHHGCKPPVIHRDVKTTNILLNEKFEAKLADFGLSRAFSVEGVSHISTAIAGTPGYLDPECFKSDRLNEKNDVYSFGVVLLEIITGQPVLVKTDDDHEYSHISQRVESMLKKGDIKNIIDPQLFGGFHVNSVWKAVEIAMSCVHTNSTERPRMNQVVTELTECLALEMAYKRDGSEQTKDSASKIILDLDSDLNPLPR